MVVAGGARSWIYGAFTNVPRRIIDALPTTPRDGTLLRDPADGTIVHIQAGTKYAFASWQELVDAGFEASVFIDVPRRVIDHFPSRASLNAAPANPPDPSLGAGDYGVNYPHGVGAVDYMYGRDGTWRTLTDVLYHWNYYPEYASAKHPFDKEMLLATADGTRNTTAPDANGHLLLDFDHDGEIDVWDAGGAFYEHNARTKGNLIKNQYQPNEQKPFTNFWFDDNWLARYMAQAYGRPLPAGLSDYDDFTRWQVLGADTQHWTPYQGAAPDQLALNGLYYLAVGHIHAAVGAWKDLLAASDFDGASGDYTGIGENYHLGLFKILTDKLLASGQVPSTDSSNFVQHSVALRSAILRNQQKTGAGAYAGWTTDVAANGLMNTESLAVNVLALATGAKTTFGAGHAPLRHTAENSYRLGAVGESLSAVPGTSLPGHITFGPNFSYPAGTYTVEFVVRAHNPQGDVANLDVYDATSGRVLAERKLTVTDLGFDVWQRVALTIQVATAPNSLEFRTWWYGGNSRLDVAEIRVR